MRNCACFLGNSAGLGISTGIDRTRQSVVGNRNENRDGVPPVGSKEANRSFWTRAMNRADRLIGANQSAYEGSVDIIRRDQVHDQRESLMRQGGSGHMRYTCGHNGTQSVYAANSSKSCLASRRSTVSNPSVNQS